MKLPERPSHRALLALTAVAVIAGYYLISRAVPNFDLEQALRDVSDALGAWTYALVGAFAFLETGAGVGLVVPGETVMYLGGAVAGQGAISIYVLIAVGWFSAWAGDTTSFFIGRRLGRGFVLEHGPRVGITRERFGRVEDYFARHGGKTILVGRFISLVRALAPFIAGSSGMPYRAFLPYSVLGTGLWSTLHLLIGYAFSRNINEVAELAGRGFFLLGVLIVVVVGIVLAVRFLRVPENRVRVVAAMERGALTRPLVRLGRRVQPQARFIWNRLTPGGTFGLEATSLLAVLAVGLYVLIAYSVIIGGDPAPTWGDEIALDWARDLERGWLTDVVEAVSHLGAHAVVIPLALACAVALGARRYWAELAVLIASMLLIFFVNPEIKDLVDRPRPPDPLTSTSGSSFPSGHAANSALYVWIALTVAIHISPGKIRRGTLIGIGVAIAAVVGLSRVYLRVHYLSDVNAGWAEGASAFAICGLVALVVTRLRQNERGAAGANQQ
jgi:membrane protein DedA with SNARE-associated domain/membrane-associated phospholipid phosphatase